MAVGGYGRAELSPGSDIDLYLLYKPGVDVAPLADKLWYPIWDEGVKLGHAVRTVKETLTLAADDLDTATAVLSARHIVGDESLSDELADQGPRPLAQAVEALARAARPRREGAPRGGR